MNKVKVEVKNIFKSYISSDDGKPLPVVEDVSFKVYEGEFLCIVGSSGCGKTTILRLIAGLQDADSGEILLDGNKIKSTSSKRGMVFQEFALFPWRTVQKNVEFGLEYKGMTPEERNELSKKFVSMVGLSGYENSYPHQLSGGMKQRVAIARALVNDPDVLLMDEPFGALDAQTRNILQDELLRIWAETKKTIIFITHNVDEAVYLGDRVLVLTKRPAKIKKEFNINLSRRRKRTNIEFVMLRKEILDELMEEINIQSPPSI
ncbi:MAG: Trehalose/maltose import ATP-binding protein MalK [Candidatus Methanofastidiosum methylothiophilum]|uniref:Molybdate/tungstate import ATP-binding protein WtpC n=1 Tax=Candidatus Methanofastidiosum methylothiophilum TaxID=1705564 RepID=A0A150JAM4_9EURY|nr:MAG: Trehalose/maltose import ATP-binding protein MalK [Candidatus Methanofastidiosum methylthiophilus]